MLQLLKKAAAAKNIPLLALALFAAVFIGNEVLASMKPAQANEHWLLDQCTDQTNPDCYSLVTDLDELCDEVDNAVCGINAPIDEDAPDEIPLIEGTLASDLQSGNFIGKPNIFRMPRTQ